MANKSSRPADTVNLPDRGQAAQIERLKEKGRRIMREKAAAKARAKAARKESEPERFKRIFNTPSAWSILN